MGTIKKSLVFAAVGLGLFVVPAHAEEVVAKVPFAFVVRGEVFPAGGYDIRTADTDVISIRRLDHAATATFALTMPAGGRDPIGNQPVLVFTHRDNAYRLSEIWESRATGLTLTGAPRPADAHAQAGPFADPTFLVRADLR